MENLNRMSAKLNAINDKIAKITTNDFIEVAECSDNMRGILEMALAYIGTYESKELKQFESCIKGIMSVLKVLDGAVMTTLHGLEEIEAELKEIV